MTYMKKPASKSASKKMTVKGKEKGGAKMSDKQMSFMDKMKAMKGKKK